MKKICLYLAMAASAVTLVACGGSSGGGVTSTAAPSAPPVQAAVNARYQIVLKDMVTDAPIQDPLVLSFSGSAPVKAADGTPLNGTSITTSAGFMGVDATFQTGTDDFTVKVADAGAKGWVTTGVTVNGATAAKGDLLVELKMINTTKAGAINASATLPVTVTVQNTAVAANGATTSATTVATPTKNVATAEGTTEPLPATTVTVPTNTVATTSGGTPASGQITIAATSFSNANVESLQAFPGGFAPNLSTTNSTVLNGATTDTASVTPASFSEFSVKDSAGNQIKNFSQPITISMDLPKSTLDDNGNPVAAGQPYPVWSFNETSQTWVFETMGTIAEKNPVSADFFNLNFQTTHLSFWSAMRVRRTCNSTVTVTGRPAGDTRALDIEIVGTKTARFYSAQVTTGGSVLFVRLPLNSAATVTVRDKGTVVGQVNNAAVCGGVTVPVSIQPAPTGVVRFETSESCTDGSNQRAVPTYVNIQTGSQLIPSYTSTIETNLASTSISGLPGASVVASALNPRNNQWTSQTVTVTANGTITTPFKFITTCNQVTGGF